MEIDVELSSASIDYPVPLFLVLFFVMCCGEWLLLLYTQCDVMFSSSTTFDILLGTPQHRAQQVISLSSTESSLL